MMQTAPLSEPLTTAIADGDSFRYYPGFAGDALERLQLEEAQSFAVVLLFAVYPVV